MCCNIVAGASNPAPPRTTDRGQSSTAYQRGRKPAVHSSESVHYYRDCAYVHVIVADASNPTPLITGRGQSSTANQRQRKPAVHSGESVHYYCDCSYVLMCMYL